jgi:hypothetical protein
MRDAKKIGLGGVGGGKALASVKRRGGQGKYGTWLTAYLTFSFTSSGQVS